SGFWHDYVVLARQIGADRFQSGWSFLLLFLPSTTVLRCILALVALFVAFRLSGGSVEPVPNRRLITWIVLGSVLYQNLFALLTSNNVENCLPYLGLIYAFSVGLLLEASLKWSIHRHYSSDLWSIGPYACMAAIVLTIVFYDGLLNSWS